MIVTLISSQVKDNINSSIYSILAIAFVVLSLKIAAPRQKIPAFGPLILIAIPPLILSVLLKKTKEEETPKTENLTNQKTEVPIEDTQIPANNPDDLISDILAFFKIPLSQHERRYPPVAFCDTMNVPINFDPEFKLYDLIQSLKLCLSTDHKLRNAVCQRSEFFQHQLLLNLLKELYPKRGFHQMSALGEHGYGLSYQDDAILAVSKITKTINVLNTEIWFSESNKPILLQQATRGCTAACVGMLVYEKNPTAFNQRIVSALSSTNLGNDNTMVASLKQSELTPLVTTTSDIEQMKSLISQHGSAIVSVDSGNGGHVIMVDAITEESVLIRDPYHGWEITITLKAFKNSNPSKMIQVQETTV